MQVKVKNKKIQMHERGYFGPTADINLKSREKKG